MTRKETGFIRGKQPKRPVKKAGKRQTGCNEGVRISPAEITIISRANENTPSRKGQKSWYYTPIITTDHRSEKTKEMRIQRSSGTWWRPEGEERSEKEDIKRFMKSNKAQARRRNKSLRMATDRFAKTISSKRESLSG